MSLIDVPRLNLLSSPPSLITLPRELLNLVFDFVDRPSALALARTGSVFAPFCDKVIWQRLDLKLNPNHGHSPSTFPPEISPRVSLSDREERAWWKGEELHQVAIKAKVAMVHMRADEKRWRMVQEVFLEPRPGAVDGMLYALEMASSSLRRLVIERSAKTDFIDDWRPPKHHQSLEIKSIDRGLSFPFLTELHIGPNAIRFAELALLLVQASPNLRCLFVDVIYDVYNLADNALSWNQYGGPSFPVIVPPTSISTMRIRFSHGWPGDNPDRDHPLHKLLRWSPNIERLSVHANSRTDAQRKSIVETAHGLTKLEYLHWEYDAQGFVDDVNSLRDVGFLRLRLLVFHDIPWSVIIEQLPAFPMIETIYFSPDEHYYFDEFDELDPCEATSAWPMLSLLARRLHESPRLRTFRSSTYLDLPPDLDDFVNLHSGGDKERPIGEVWSYHHAGSEILHLRLMGAGSMMYRSLDLANAADQGYIFPRSPEEERQTRTFGDGELGWWDYTDLDAAVVPLSVLEEMRVAEGASIVQWERRGVEVGEAGWAVLSAWQQGC